MLKIILAEINIMQFIYVAPWQVRSRSFQERRREHLFSCWPVSVNLYIIYRGMKWRPDPDTLLHIIGVKSCVNQALTWIR